MTEESEKYLNKESPDYMGDISEFLVQESIPKWMNLTKSIKDGGFIQEKSSKSKFLSLIFSVGKICKSYDSFE